MTADIFVRSSVQPLMDVVFRCLKEENWNYQVVEPGALIRMGVRGERGTWICYLRVAEGQRQVIFYAQMGMNIPPEKRAEVIEYLTRANYSLPVGGFEMDVDSGEIRFKNSLETPEGELSVAMVRALALTSLRVMDRYFMGVLSVVHRGLSPQAALAQVESQAVAPG